MASPFQEKALLGKPGASFYRTSILKTALCAGSTFLAANFKILNEWSSPAAVRSVRSSPASMNPCAVSTYLAVLSLGLAALLQPHLAPPQRQGVILG